MPITKGPEFAVLLLRPDMRKGPHSQGNPSTPLFFYKKNGAGEGIRPLAFTLGKVALYP